MASDRFPFQSSFHVGLKARIRFSVVLVGRSCLWWQLESGGAHLPTVESSVPVTICTDDVSSYTKLTIDLAQRSRLSDGQYAEEGAEETWWDVSCKQSTNGG